MKIILTLTTVPNRLCEKREHMGTIHGLRTILNQSYDNFEVHFNIPREYRGELIDIPEWLTELQQTFPFLKIFRTEDYGPVTKILPTLERGGDPEDIIITVDDDLIYMDGIIPAHLDGRNRYPNCAIGFAGLGGVQDRGIHHVTSYNRDIRVKILEGYKTVSYTRSWFDVQEFKDNFALEIWQDDHSISAYMGYKNIEKWCLTHSSIIDFSPRVESFPVVKHAKVERGGCRLYRDIDDSGDKANENKLQQFYKLGYLDR
jgi:hypothetical protein